MRKVFVCGCGHTGTTLLATMLSTHSKIYNPFVETWSYADPKHSYLLDLLIEEAKTRKEEVFLEKTPKHIYYVDKIRKDHNPHFIFTVRNGYDCVMSLEKRYEDFDKAFNRYIDDHLEVIKNDGHIVRYEDLISNTEIILRQICEYIELEFENQMLKYYEISLPDWRDPDDNPNMWKRNNQVKMPIYKPEHPQIDEWFKEKCRTSEFIKIMEHFGYEY